MNKRAYRLLIIGMSENYGGVETYIKNMIHHFTPGRLTLFFPTRKAELAYQSDLLKLGATIIPAPLARGIHFMTYYWQWNEIFRKFRFDAIYMNDCSIVNIDVLRLAKLHHIPVRILHSHSSSTSTPAKGLRKLIEHWNRYCVSRISTNMFACSQDSGKWMFGTKKEFSIIPNAIMVNKFKYSEAKRAQIRTELGLNNKFVIGFIGRLALPKLPEFFIQVFSEFKKQHHNTTALVVGNGELRESVEETINSCGLNNESVLMLGVRSDIHALLSAMDCLVMPSLHEGFPYVLVEAQASGLPCVVSDTIAEETNITGDVQFVSLDAGLEVWCQAIQSTDTRKERTAGAQKIKDANYDIESVAESIEELIISGIEKTIKA